LGTTKIQKIQHPTLLKMKKKLGLLGACWLTSLAAKNFYGYLGSLRGMSKVLLLVKRISFVSFGILFKCICLCEKV
jgi:hypothetical protein